MKLQITTIAIVILSNFQITIRGDESETLSCGRRLVNHEALIVNGYTSKEKDWPWHAAILHVALNQNIEYKCGGTLLNSNSILTAAHCVYENGRPIVADRVVIQLGRHNLKISGVHTQEIEAFKTIPHPNFNESSLSNDIAIIRLATLVTFNDYVQPICLWDSNKEDLSEVVGKYGTVVGFGITEENKISYTLQQAVIPVVSLTTCLGSDRSFYGNFLSDYTFCAGYQNGTTACNGDSGGGLVFEENGVYSIRGIVSLTQARPTDQGQFCKTDQYVVFTDVAKYLHWIEGIVPDLPSPSTVDDDVTVSEVRNWESSKLMCKFGWNNDEKRYECHDSSFSSTADNVRISSVAGTFNDGRTYSDVNTVVINSGRTTHIPEMSELKKIFPNFVRLFITNSGLKHVERSKLKRLSQLRILNFYGNQIEALNEDVLYDLPNLEIFACVTNRISILPENLLSKQVKLKEFWAWDNRIELIPRNFFKNNKELTHLWLATNLIKKIDANFNQLLNLKVLDLRGNKCIDAQACDGCGIKFNEINGIVDKNCK